MQLETNIKILAKLNKKVTKMPVSLERLCRRIERISDFEISFETERKNRKKLLSAILDYLDVEDVNFGKEGVEEILMKLYA